MGRVNFDRSWVGRISIDHGSGEFRSIMGRANFDRSWVGQISIDHGSGEFRSIMGRGNFDRSWVGRISIDHGVGRILIDHVSGAVFQIIHIFVYRITHNVSILLRSLNKIRPSAPPCRLASYTISRYIDSYCHLQITKFILKKSVVYLVFRRCERCRR